VGLVGLDSNIRREYEFGIGTIMGVAKKLAVHRRMVREAIGSALPKPRKKPARPRWKLRAAIEFVDAILEADRKAPRKQRHTAHRIWARMHHELLERKIAERTLQVRARPQDRAGTVRARDLCSSKLRLGARRRLIGPKPMRSCDLAGERVELQVFGLRSMGQRSGIPLRLSACNTARFSGGARPGVRLLRRCIPQATL